MDREFARELLTDKRELLGRILAFNREEGQEEPWADYPALAQALAENYHLKRRLGSSRQIYCDFESFANRLVLLPSEIFTPLELMLSACVCSEFLQAGIFKHTVKRYKELLGEQYYYLGLKRGRFYLGTALKNKICAEFSSPEEALSRAGIFCVSLCASKASAFCKERLELGDVVAPAPKQQYSDEEYRKLSLGITKVIIKEIDPTCQNILR